MNDNEHRIENQQNEHNPMSNGHQEPFTEDETDFEFEYVAANDPLNDDVENQPNEVNVKAEGDPLMVVSLNQAQIDTMVQLLSGGIDNESRNSNNQDSNGNTNGNKQIGAARNESNGISTENGNNQNVNGSIRDVNQVETAEEKSGGNDNNNVETAEESDHSNAEDKSNQSGDDSDCDVIFYGEVPKPVQYDSSELIKRELDRISANIPFNENVRNIV